MELSVYLRNKSNDHENTGTDKKATLIFFFHLWFISEHQRAHSAIYTSQRFDYSILKQCRISYLLVLGMWFSGNVRVGLTESHWTHGFGQTGGKEINHKFSDGVLSTWALGDMRKSLQDQNVINCSLVVVTVCQYFSKLLQ